MVEIQLNEGSDPSPRPRNVGGAGELPATAELIARSRNRRDGVEDCLLDKVRSRSLLCPFRKVLLLCILRLGCRNRMLTRRRNPLLNQSRLVIRLRWLRWLRWGWGCKDRGDDDDH